MGNNKINLLLIEDDPEDAVLIKEMLGERRDRFNLKWVDRLTTGLDALNQTKIDLLILDLGLPESKGIDTLKKVLKVAGSTPIVILTGLTDEMLALKAVQMGAQDYLVKGKVDGDLMIRSIRYSIERQRLIKELERVRELKSHTREIDSLERMSHISGTHITSRMFGSVPIKESLPDSWREFTNQYETLIEQALEHSAHKVEYNLYEEMQKLSEELGQFKAGPRDILDIHLEALRNKMKNSNVKKKQAYIDECRLMVLELMGHLASYYRNYSIGVTKPFDDNKGRGG